MTTKYLAGVLAGAALICAAHPVVAQDKGKTEAAELTQRGADRPEAAVRERAAGEGTRAEGACHPGVPRGDEGRPRESAGNMAKARC